MFPVGFLPSSVSLCCLLVQSSSHSFFTSSRAAHELINPRGLEDQFNLPESRRLFWLLSGNYISLNSLIISLRITFASGIQSAALPAPTCSHTWSICWSQPCTTSLHWVSNPQLTSSTTALEYVSTSVLNKFFKTDSGLWLVFDFLPTRSCCCFKAFMYIAQSGDVLKLRLNICFWFDWGNDPKLQSSCFIQSMVSLFSYRLGTGVWGEVVAITNYTAATKCFTLVF